MTSINNVLISLFTVITVVTTSLVSKSHRWKLLLGISLLFYYLLIGDKIIVVIALSLITYTFSHLIHAGKNLIVVSVTLLLVPLMLLKSIRDGNHFDSYRTFDIAPDNWLFFVQIIGLSYFTFNSISYLIDIKRKYISPQRNFFYLLLYLVYFPAIFSGPLHRAAYLFEAFKNIEVTNNSISKGLRLILWGLFKNVVIAQRIFLLMVQLQSSALGGVYYLIVGLLFFLYLYCNFSSFIDFFQGVSQIFNIRLKDNFKNRVYFSASRQEFWRGWHITLNQWFRDYFFYVIAGNDKKRRYTDIILLITFLLIALWHGFSLVMVVWGLLNGLWIVIEKKVDFQKWKDSSFRKVMGVAYHLSLAALLALIFISPQVDFLYQKVFVQSSRLPENFMMYLPSTLIILVCFGIMDYHYAKAGSMRFDEYIERKPQYLRWLIYGKITMIILIFGKSAGIENYYIQF
jgi:alginate O-acetyltransferase complex protein AlgI